MISTFCANGACIEVERTRADGTPGDMVAIRSTLQPDRVAFATREEWTAFVAGVKAGEFDKLFDDHPAEAGS